MKFSKKLIISSVTLALLLTSFSFASISNAEESSPTTRSYTERNETKNKIQDRREEIKEKTEEKREEIKERLSTAKKERVMSFSNKIILRLEATTERLQKLITRIDERIMKIDEEGNVSTTTAKTSLASAQKLLTETIANIAVLKTEMETISTSEDPKTSFETARETLSSIKEDLKSVHKILVDTIGIIKGLRVGDTQNER